MSRPRSSTLDRQTGASRPLGSSLGPRGRHQSPPDLRGTAERLALDRRPARRARGGPGRDRRRRGDTVVRLDLDRPVPDDTRAELSRIFADRFGTDATKTGRGRASCWPSCPGTNRSRDLAWAAYKASPAHEPLRREFEAKTVATKDRKSPYLWRHVGQKPADGWALVIAMHGGGSAPADVNDQQWRGDVRAVLQGSSRGGRLRLPSLRAPNDTWNGFYDDAICPLVERLIRQFVLFGDVNPDRVYTLGASHGGYGAFVIGPKMPDRFAAVHASAAAPTPGETRGENLRDVRFTFMVGEQRHRLRPRRTMPGVRARDSNGWKSRYGGYPGALRVGARRRPLRFPTATSSPRCSSPARVNHGRTRIVWAQSDDVLKHFYWIEAPHPDAIGPRSRHR